MTDTFSDDYTNATETIASIPVRLLQNLCVEGWEAERFGKIIVAYAVLHGLAHSSISAAACTYRSPLARYFVLLDASAL